jgi:DNA modification methylase
MSLKMNEITCDLHLGDCVKAMKRCLPKKTMHLFVLDPPYNLANTTSVVSFNERKDIGIELSASEWDKIENYLKWCKSWLKIAYEKLIDDSSMYVFVADKTLSMIGKIAENVGFVWDKTITWIKTNPAPQIRKSTFVSACEYILYFTKGNPTFNFTIQKEMMNYIPGPITPNTERWYYCKKCKNALMFNQKKYHEYHEFFGSDKKEDHKGHKIEYVVIANVAQKPEWLISKLIRISSNVGDLVGDFFLGTGTTGRVSIDLRRNFFGVEKDRRFYKIIKKRLQYRNRSLDEFF